MYNFRENGTVSVIMKLNTNTFLISLLALLLSVTTLPCLAGGFGIFASHMDTSDLDNSVGFGGRLQVDLSKQALLDISVAYHDGLDDMIGDEEVQLELLPAEIGLLFKIGVADEKIFPYIGAGAGYYRLDLDDGDPLTDDDNGGLDDEVGWYGMLGLDFRLTPAFGLFVEGRYREIEGTLEGNRFNRLDDDELDLDLGGITINTGLQFNW